MSGFADYEQYDALGLAELVRRGKVTPAELLEAAIERYQRSIEVHPTAEAHTFLGWT
jgi:amidase